MPEHTATHRGRPHGPPSQQQHDARHLAVAGAFVFVAAFALMLLCMDREVGPYDEGIVLFGAARVASGDVPHRDFYANYGPAQFYILAFLFEVFSPSVLVERAWDAAARSASVVLTFLIVARVASIAAAWLAALASLAWLAALGSHGYPVFPALAAALASLLCLMPAFAGAYSAPWLLAAGSCVGLVALFRYDVGFFVLVAEGLVLGACTLSRARQAGQGASRQLVRAALPFGAGLGLVALPVAAAYAAAGVLDGFFFDIVSFPSQHYARTRSLPFPIRSALRGRPPAISVYLPPLACAAAMPAILASVRRPGGHGEARRFWTLLGLMALAAAFFAKGFVRVSPLHMVMAIIPSVSLVTVLADHARRERGREPIIRWSARVGATGAAILTLGALLTTVERAGLNLARLAQGTGCQTPAGFERLACFTVDQNRADAIQYVQQRTGADEAILVGLGRHDKIFVNDVAFYFLAGRWSATRWHHMDPGLQTAAPIQREMVAELSARRPRFVLLDSRWDAVEEPNASAVGSGVTILDDYIRSHFTPVARFGTMTVLQDPRPRAAP